MLSSISSSNKTSSLSFKATFICTFLAISAYCLIIEMWPPKITMTQNQWVDNKVFTERYLYSDKPINTVITGSSLAFRLPQESLNETTYNLSLAANSAITGLEIVTNNQNTPKQILIETNLLDRQSNQTFIDEIFHPVYHPIKSVIKATHHEYQPINLLLSAIRYIRPTNKPQKNQPINIETLNRNVAAKKELYNAFSSKPVFEKNLEILAKKIHDLKQQQVHVIFLEMPIDTRLEQTTRVQYMRTQLQQYFPPEKNHWITFNHLENLQTTDGIHLTQQSATLIAQEIMAQL